MSDQIKPLEKVFYKVLEDWAMMLVDPSASNTELFETNEQLFMSQINMSGAFHGTICIVAQKPFIQALAQNLLGGDVSEDKLDEQSIDAFREMGNVLAGNFITEAYGTATTFDMLNPQVLEISKNELDKIAQSKDTCFALADDVPVCVSFNIDN